MKTNILESTAESDRQQADRCYPFEGKHSFASYSGCDLSRLNDVPALLEAFRQATIASGAKILSENHHVFSPGGLTAMLLLSESHASIHTYPEHSSCFCDLFTCGDHCDVQAFHSALQAYLRPTHVEAQTIVRNGGGSPV